MVSLRLGFANDLRGSCATRRIDERATKPAGATGYARPAADHGQPSRLSAAASNCGHILLKYRYQENKRFILLDANTTTCDLKTSQLSH